MEENKTNLPWGTLTGVRPTKLAYKLISQGLDPAFLTESLMQNYGIRLDKANLVARILKNQKCIIRNDNLVNLYINIPICPSRCVYCSFISSEIGKVKPILPTYLDCLIKEIRAMKNLIAKKPYVVRTIYIGGGTPTVLEPNELDLLLQEIGYSVNEFTVECGRADTITKEKLEVLKKYGVTRISINPQTFSQKTLKTIGRKHTIADVLNAYKLALGFGFKVNMDLIAGLQGETLRTFKNTIKTVLELSPENITVHTLSIKKGSLLQAQEIENSEVEKMIDFAYEALTKDEYKPYYMYRQKHQLGGLENVGYCKENEQCIFNIDSMEETCSIIACGANAISKKVLSFDNTIFRSANVKFIEDYITRIDEIIKNKLDLFK
ncbi:MAG: coproporphyrinogen dehydrogenase HemZ [Clostridia bacterium]|nr:coproporphyrinogen dehydrogenase HemZ [Clostridia bacterium]